jgi:hypothetical protein
MLKEEHTTRFRICISILVTCRFNLVINRLRLGIDRAFLAESLIRILTLATRFLRLLWLKIEPRGTGESYFRCAIVTPALRVYGARLFEW